MDPERGPGIERADDRLDEGQPNGSAARYMVVRRFDVAGQPNMANAHLAGLQADMQAQVEDAHCRVRELPTYLARREKSEGAPL